MCLAESRNDARFVWYFAESYWFRGIGSLSEAVFSQGTNGDDSQSAPHPEPRVSKSQITQKSGLDDGYDMVTGASEEISYCSRWRSSRKQRKTCSSSQSHFRSTNTLAATEVDQISLACQQLGNNSNSRIFGDNIYRSSKLMESSTTTMATFEGKLEKFALFGEIFQLNRIFQNHLTGEGRMDYFVSPMRADALQTIKNVSNPTRENLRELLAVFRGIDVKHQSMTTAKPRFQKLVFNPANQIMADLLIELQKLTKDVFIIAAHAIFEQFIHAKMPTCLKKSYRWNFG